MLFKVKSAVIVTATVMSTADLALDSMPHSEKAAHAAKG
jgi:hypothetical protein